SSDIRWLTPFSHEESFFCLGWGFLTQQLPPIVRISLRLDDGSFVNDSYISGVCTDAFNLDTFYFSEGCGRRPDRLIASYGRSNSQTSIASNRNLSK
ncbi:hypothetical protein, partial [Microcoleus anatoxicus]